MISIISDINIIFNGLYYVIMIMEKLLGGSIITSFPEDRWVYTFFVILRYGKLGSWWCLINVRDVTVTKNQWSAFV